MPQDAAGEPASLSSRAAEPAVAVAQPPPVGEFLGGLLPPVEAQLAAVGATVGPARAGTGDPPGR
ncbi:hypothetical protein [Euzebya pacifica]|uniref:hypothetical protein n=1 Tax=Euzebya pacifica TaxID=1608957 RepID=UPI0030F9BA68